MVRVGRVVVVVEVVVVREGGVMRGAGLAVETRHGESMTA